MRDKWAYKDFPDKVTITIKNGPADVQTDFIRARWAKPEKGVKAQYRQAHKKNSAHLKVYDDNTWHIDHVDKHNPDLGSAVGHFFGDYNSLLGPLLLSGTVIVGAVSLLRRKVK